MNFNICIESNSGKAHNIKLFWERKNEIHEQYQWNVSKQIQRYEGCLAMHNFILPTAKISMRSAIIRFIFISRNVFVSAKIYSSSIKHNAHGIGMILHFVEYRIVKALHDSWVMAKTFHFISCFFFQRTIHVSSTENAESNCSALASEHIFNVKCVWSI